MKPRLFVPAVVAACLAVLGWGMTMTPASTEAGPRLTMAEKVFQAENILELTLPLDIPIPKTWPNKRYDPKGLAFPTPLFERAMKGMKVERVLKPLPNGKTPQLPKQVYVFSIGSPCWWKAHEQGSLRSLVFLKGDAKGRFEDSGGVEHEQGLYSDLNPDYERLVQAIREVASWKKGRSEPVPQEERAAQRKILTTSHDPYRLYLTVQFLRRHAPEVLDEVWGAAGTSGRIQYDKMVTEPTMPSVCLPAS